MITINIRCAKQKGTCLEKNMTNATTKNSTVPWDLFLLRQRHLQAYTVVLSQEQIIDWSGVSLVILIVTRDQQLKLIINSLLHYSS